MDIGQLIRRQVTLRTYVSRYTRLIQTGKTVAGVAKNQELLDKYTLELSEVDKKLQR